MNSATCGISPPRAPHVTLPINSLALASIFMIGRLYRCIDRDLFTAPTILTYAQLGHNSRPCYEP
jgi:hypothetical protein